jgi:hypothetical protein
MYCPISLTDAQSQKRKKNYKKEKSRYSNLFLKIAVLAPPRQHQKFSPSKSDASEGVHDTIYDYKDSIIQIKPMYDTV